MTILLGANDLCTSSPSTMTPTETFRAQFSQAMATLMAGQDPYVLVSSIPNIHQLWEVLHQLPGPLGVGDGQDLPVDAGGDPDRGPTPAGGGPGAGVQPDLAEVCGAYARCRWDGGAVYDYRFSASQVGTWTSSIPASAARRRWRVSLISLLVAQHLTKHRLREPRAGLLDANGS